MSENAKDKTTNNALVVISNEYTSTPIGLTTTASHHHNINDVEDTPRIICNELLVKPLKSTSLEKLDELSSLEREIAKMHHVEDETNLDDSALMSDLNIHQAESHGGDAHVQHAKEGISRYNELPNGANAKNKNDKSKSFEEKLEDKLEAITSGETALEHEDLIAVLKGLDSTATDDINISSIVLADSVLEEEGGVTIEGEGEYQIMEVIDDDSNAAAEVPAVKADAQAADHSAVMNTKKTFGSTTLTLQQERALALEQMEVLKSSRVKQQRRRKQDIKPIKQVDPALELVTALEAEWSENDDDMANDKPSTSEVKSKSSTATTTSIAKSSGDNKTNVPLVTSVVVLPTQIQSTAASSSISPKLTTVNATTVTSSSGTVEDKISTKSSSPTEEVVSSQTGTGFRRTRIIKRKIIWDPDAPETTFSYAKLVKPSSNNTKGKMENIHTATITKGSTTITPIKKETTAATSSTVAAKKTQQRPTTPKDTKLSSLDVNNEKKTLTKSSEILTKTNIGIDNTKSINKTEETKTAKSAKSTSSDSIEEKTTASSTKTSSNSPIKRRSQTPVANSSGGVTGVKKKKISEVDRLMGDEGAANMLNSLEKLEANLGGSETMRPMMRSRAATICERIPRKEPTTPEKSTSPSNATTSEATTTATTENQQTTTSSTTNKGKRTNKPRASSSWDYVYKQKEQNFDDSLIIRRRSNSSYSSTTSLNRLSLDGQPASIATTNSTAAAAKSNDMTDEMNSSLPASTTPTSSSATTKSSPSSSSNHNKSAGSSKSNSTPTSAGKSFEFAKPENKKTQKRTKSPAATLTNDMKKSAPGANKRNTRSPATSTSDDNKEVQKSTTKSPPSSSSSTKERKEASSSTPTPGTQSDVVVKKSSKVAQIIFSTNKAKLSNTFTVQMLNKLVDILDKLAADPDCHVVVMTTNDIHFCQGVDITDLTKTSSDKRKNYATHLATAVKNYLKTLATYPKPLVAGINGSIMNLGVIQLALFDVVIAGDKTTFETPYAKMAQEPEGYCIWNNMNKIRGSFKTKLFWLCERIQSTEAALAGLVSKLTSANKVNDEALNTAKKIASYSAESYRAMKKTIISSNLDVVENSLDDEFNSIIKQWTSSECLENLKKYVDQGHY